MLRAGVVWYCATLSSGALVLASSCLTPCGDYTHDTCEVWSAITSEQAMASETGESVQVSNSVRTELTLTAGDPEFTGAFYFEPDPAYRSYKLAVTRGTLVTRGGEALTDPDLECEGADTYAFPLPPERAEFVLRATEAEVAVAISPVYLDGKACSGSGSSRSSSGSGSGSDGDFDFD